MSEQKVKVSAAQARVVTRIQEGWELGFSKPQNKYWLQQRGIGKGGSTERVARTTGSYLGKMQIVNRVAPSFPTERYKLAEGCVLSDNRKYVTFPVAQEQHYG